jgi:hypothetical protein
MGHSRLHQAEPAAELSGKLGIAGKRRRLVLPQIQVSTRKRFEIRRLRHAPTIAKAAMLRCNIRAPVFLACPPAPESC